MMLFRDFELVCNDSYYTLKVEMPNDLTARMAINGTNRAHVNEALRRFGDCLVREVTVDQDDETITVTVCDDPDMLPGMCDEDAEERLHEMVRALRRMAATGKEIGLQDDVVQSFYGLIWDLNQEMKLRDMEVEE